MAVMNTPPEIARRQYDPHLGDPTKAYNLDPLQQVRRLRSDPTSIILYIDCYLSNRGLPGTDSDACYAVFFHSNSKLNARVEAPIYNVSNASKARLLAIERGLRDLMLKFKKEKGSLTVERIVVCTDDVGVVEGITRKMFGEDGTTGFRSKVSRVLFEVVDRLVTQFQEKGIEVNFCKIEPKDNMDAYKYARELNYGVRGGETSFEGDEF